MIPEGRRLALLVACSDFPKDKTIHSLTSPKEDAAELARVLKDPEIGGFEVTMLENCQSQDLCDAIEDFRDERERNDLLLLYYSGHGIRNDEGQLYLATVDTTRARLRRRAVSTEFINKAMNDSRSRYQVLILDCCRAGAYGRRMELEGMLGRVVLTATDPIQEAYQGNEGSPSVFTRPLVRGLETGEADRDGDGLVSCVDLYDYVYRQMIRKTPLQTPGIWVLGSYEGIYIAQSPRGLIRDARAPRYAVLADTTLPDTDAALYDRGSTLDGIQEAFSENDPLRVWIKGEEYIGKTASVKELVDRCLDKELFDDCIYFEPGSKRCQAGVTYGAFVFEKMAEAGWKLANSKILLVVDDFDFLPSFEKKQVLDFLHMKLRRGWGAVVVGQSVDRRDQWWVIDLAEPLRQGDLEKFVSDYISDKSKSTEDQSKSRVRKALEDADKKWESKLYKATQGDQRKLLAALERMEQGESFSAVLNWLRNLSDSDNPMRVGVMEAVKNLEQDHLRLLRLLSLFKASASLEMLESISRYTSSELDNLLNDLIESRYSLVEAVPAEGGTDDKRYRITAGKKKYVSQLEQCTRFDKELVPQFIHWWRRDYAWEHQEIYSRLSIEHQNLMGVLDQLWALAGVRVHDEYDSDSGNPLPLDAFSIEDRDAADQYIRMRDSLREYLCDEGRWLEYRRGAERAYALACALGKRDDTVQAALDVADTHCREGRYSYSPSELKMAEDWVTRADEALKRGRFTGDFMQLRRADALRIRGVMAMRRCGYEGRCSYQKSRTCFEEALDCLEQVKYKGADEVKRIQDINCYLAQLEMRYALRSEKAKEDLKDFIEETIESAKDAAELYKQIENDFQKSQSVLSTNLAELEIWWGDWNNAAQALEEALPLSHKLGRKDLLAEGLYLQAFVHQENSKNDNIDELNNAIQEARKALAVVESIPASEHFIKLCGTYLLLAGLYFCRREMRGHAEDHDRFQDYLNKARDLLEMHSAFRAGAETRLDPNTNYQRVCHRILSGAFEEADDLLLATLQIQPGLVYRALNDFRFYPPIVPEERQWKWKAYLPETPSVTIGLDS